MGRSAVAVLRNKFSSLDDIDLTLIGSESSQLDIDGVKYAVLDGYTARKKIEKIDILFNAAFLRKEFLKRLTHYEYVTKNNQISTFALSLLEDFQPSVFINLSSGAAAQKTMDVKVDPYGFLKLEWERRFLEACSLISIKLINCRIYSLTGRFINEFQNLALSQFILSALHDKKIDVRSANTLRTYVDSETLCHLLFCMAFQGEKLSFDSGGVLTSMESLANSIKSLLNVQEIDLKLSNDYSENYFGDHADFQKLLDEFNINLESLDEQVSRTLTAFI